MNSKNVALVEEIAEKLSKNEIRYRFVDQRWKDGGDVDIIVNKKDIKKFHEIISKYKFVRKGRWPPSARAYKAYQNNENIFFGAHIGGFIGAFGGGLGRFGKKFNPQTVKSAKNKHLENEAQLLTLIFKYATRPNKREKYIKYYEQQIKKKYNEEKLNEWIEAMFNDPEKIIKAVKKKKPLASMNPRVKFVRIFPHMLKANINKTLKFIYKTIKPAPYVAFVGCNGVGKSTQTQALVDKLRNEKLKVDYIYSGRFTFQILPINWIMKYFTPDEVKNTEKKKYCEENGLRVREIRVYHNKFYHYIVPFVYYVEYLLRYIFKIRPKRVSNDIVLTDRSFIDIFNSPNMNPKVSRFLFKLMPRPKHILLYNDPKVLMKRRPEIPVDQLKGQLKLYKSFNKIYVKKYKTDNPEIVNDISKYLEKLI